MKFINNAYFNLFYSYTQGKSRGSDQKPAVGLAGTPILR